MALWNLRPPVAGKDRQQKPRKRLPSMRAPPHNNTKLNNLPQPGLAAQSRRLELRAVCLIEAGLLL